SLTGAIGYSHNIRAHALYSGSLGAFLEPNNNNNTINNQYDAQTYSTLQCATNWLADNNPYLRPFTTLNPQHNLNDPFPRAKHSQTAQDPPPINSNEIIIPSYNFPEEVHDKDFHYMRLMAGFVQEENSTRLPISTYDSNLEPLLFPDIFTDGRRHFHDLPNIYSSNNENHGDYIVIGLSGLISSPTRKIKAPSKRPPNTTFYTNRSNNKHALTDRKTTTPTELL
ncbi:1983_t:CDS:2, partial [Gigaspora rosea]